MANFTDQKQRIATEEDCDGPWGGEKHGKRFRCYLCGHKFVPGDKWRWVCAAASVALYNLLVCEQCDGEDVLERWQRQNDEATQRFWWFQP